MDAGQEEIGGLGRRLKRRDGQTWWLLDYQTSRPAAGEDWEAFITQETEKYRPQLLAYREMAAKAKGIEPPEAIRLGVYFTACRKVVEV